MLNLDTHILVLYLGGRLSPEEPRCLTGQNLAISAIALWELAMLAEHSRLSFNLDHPEFHAFLPILRVFPITLAIARKSSQLDFSSDPADEIIAATSIVEKIPLLTRDKRIRRSRMVPLALRMTKRPARDFL